MQTVQPPSTLPVSASRRALAGFFISGFLLAFVGAILPAWGYHLRPHYITAGNYFLTVNAGALLAIGISRKTLNRHGTGGSLVIACGVACASLLALAFTGPPASEWSRFPGLVGLGFGAGLLNTAIFHAISPAYRLNPAATVNVAGALFGFGASFAPLLIAGTFDFYNFALTLAVVAIAPGAFAIYYSRTRFPVEPLSRQRPAAEVMREFTVPAAILFTLLLFFHFGNEWAIAGWLPLFLIQRLGISPDAALAILCAYWVALTIGRLAVQTMLPHFSHFLLLLGSAVAALVGCLILAFTNNLFGAWFGTLLLGFGFAPVYPLVVERIGARFPHYHPGFFNGIFSVGLTGGMLAPATLGYLSEYFGIRVVAVLPAIGTFIVAVLVLVIWLEAKLAEWNTGHAASPRRP